ncbi:hypothetical protein LPB19_10235 [Marinobacter salinisoli]|uniref:Uncharacterized protein n=1 Tax=Marinobacter salinisoli TaxID=2769486 RepID=A0ABX7MN29_9GAMM|nr:hypothetical protein [Marinobacter salinisoli]QSP93594.1 hypothetical protein LPB19_10235 [Marinobacter salinisoli]
MSTTTIVFILAAVVTASIVIIVIAQMRERARIERARKITAHENAYNRAHRLLAEIPGQYLNTDLKLILVNQMEYACRQLGGLKSDLPVQRWLESTLRLKHQVLENEDHRKPVKIDSPERASQVKELLQNLFNLIESTHKSGQIDSATAKKNLKYVLFLVHKTHADLHVFQARDFVKQNQIRKAIHAYHLASTELGKSRDNPRALRAIKSFRTRIKELESLNAEGKETANSELQAKLDREWDNFLHDNEWKKRADYDS